MTQADSKSSSGQEQQQNTQTAPNFSPYSQDFEDDTINLYELWITLWNRKLLIIAVTVVTAIGSIIYALRQQQIYKAEAMLLQPKAKHIYSMIENLNSGKENSNQDGFPASFIFSKFKQNVNSRSLHKKFIQEKGLMEILTPDRTTETRDEDIYEKFAKLIKLVEKDGIASLSIELHDAEIAAQWVNDLVEFVNIETVNMLVEELQSSISNQTRKIEYSIASKRQMAKQRREDMIIQYQEAASIAQKLGVMDRVNSTNIVQNNQLNISTSNIPLYFRGYMALTTEISFLKSRDTDDPFISGLRDLQENLTLLRSIKFDQEKMSAVYIDQEAYPRKSPFKPDRRLIVSLSTVVGLFSGIFLAFFINFVQNQRKKYSE